MRRKFLRIFEPAYIAHYELLTTLFGVDGSLSVGILYDLHVFGCQTRDETCFHGTIQQLENQWFIHIN
jgi:hypothetical protein